ncbi:TRAP transporter substrate-binding protein DctP [Paracoccaceae bacterium GXU_MW_L88]
MKTLFKTTSLAALASAMVAGPVLADQWKYALEEAIDEVQGVYATEFKNYVEENSDHTVEIFPFGTLGESADTTELAQMGAIQFVTASPGFMGALIPELQAFLLPYLLPEDQAVLAELYKESPTINEMLAGKYAEQQLEFIDMYPEGEVVMTTKEAVSGPADLDGVKFRVMTSPMLVETYNAFGATPTPLPWGEVFSSLQLNMIQGQENPMFFVESTKMYEVTDHITYAGHNTFTTAVLANQNFFSGLSDEDKQLVRDAADAAYDHIIEYQQGLTEESEAKILEAKPDMTVTVLSDEERQPFRDAAQQVREVYLAEGGPDAQAVLDGFAADIEAAQAAVGGDAAAAENAEQGGDETGSDTAAEAAEGAAESGDDAEAPATDDANASDGSADAGDAADAAEETASDAGDAASDAASDAADAASDAGDAAADAAGDAADAAADAANDAADAASDAASDAADAAEDATAN